MAPRIPANIRHAITTPRENGRRPRPTLRNTSQRQHTQRTPQRPRHAATQGNKTLRANITIASLNINGGGTLQTREKWQHVDQLLRNNKIGILAVQETHLKEDTINSLHEQFHQRLHIINSSVPEHPNAMGVAIVLNKSHVAWKEATVNILVPGRAILVSVPWHKESIINVMAIYAPNRESENADFWDGLKEKWLAGVYSRPDVLLGDFNCVEADIDRLPVKQNAPTAARALEEFKSELMLMDGWRQENPNKRAYSWSDKMGRRSRLDRIYIGEEILACSREWVIKKTALTTDHNLISMNFSNPGAPYIGRGRWSIPLFLLQDHKVMKKIRELGIQLMDDFEKCRLLRTRDGNPQVLHQKFKKDIQSFVREYAKTITPKLDKLISKKEKMLDTILNDNDLDLTEKQMTAAILDEEIQSLEKQRHTKARDRTATKYRLEAEIMSKTWCRSGKVKKPRDILYSLKVPHTEPPTYEKRSDRMAEIARDYHETLQEIVDVNDQQNREAEIDNVLKHVKVSIPANEKRKLAEKLMPDEVRKAIRDLPNGKAAGMDGMPHELWKMLVEQHDNNEKQKRQTFDVIKMLTTLYNDIEEQGMLAGTDFSKGWMCPIYKKSDRTEIANYRPITVLNTDYKIFTRALTTKLTDAVPGIIHRDQAGFMKGRRIEDQTDLVKLLINMCEVEEINGAIICLDQEKAYDKIAHDFLFRSLAKFDLPEHFVNIVRSLYCDAHTVVIINGEISSPFKITRGVRQGDPLSCLLFNIAIESLATMLRESDLEGLRIKGVTERNIAALFADDTTVFLSENDNFSDLQDILQEWCCASKAKFNTQKTEIIPVGPQAYRTEVTNSRKLNTNHPTIPPQIHIAKDGEPVRVLGAFVGNKVDQVNVWVCILEKTDNALAQWEKSRPTPDGRRLIVGMVIGGYTQYLTRVQGMPEEIERLFTKRIRNFMSGGKVPMIGLPILHGNLEDGGKRVLDIVARNQAIELMKVKNYLLFDQNRPKWAFIADTLISKNITTQSRVHDDLSKTNLFLQSWKTNKTKNTNTLSESLCRMIRTANKFCVAFNPMALDSILKRRLPIWHHLGLGSERIRNNGTREICLRNTHEIVTVGDLEHFACRDQLEDHRPTDLCKCESCRLKRIEGCTKPHGCQHAAMMLLNKLPPKWDPRIPVDDTHNATEVGGDSEDFFTFSTDLTTRENITEGFRVFTSLENGLNTIAVRDNPPRGLNVITQLSIGGFCEESGNENAQAGAGGWFPADDGRTFSVKLPPSIYTTQAAEIASLAVALARTQTTEELIITCGHKSKIMGLLRNVQKLEDRGWINTQNKCLLRKVVAALRCRGAETSFRQARKGEDATRMALEKAKDGIREAITTFPDLTMPGNFEVKGAKLSMMTQALLYQGIMERKAKPSRRGTVIGLDMARHAVQEVSGYLPTDQKIWLSLKNQDIAKNTRAYLWKCIHNAHRCGAFWLKIPGYEQRATCHICGCDESMEHIITECHASGQVTVWKLVCTLFNKKGIPHNTTPSFGQVLGCGLVNLHNQKGKSQEGHSRLYTIVISESAYLIWRLRCEWKFERGENEERIHTTAEIESRWIAMINTKLKFDCLMTDRRRYGRKAINPEVVRKTWNGVLSDERSLPDDWVSEAGVLVGMRVSRPPGRNR